MKMKKTIDMNVDGHKKTKTLEDGTVVTDSEQDDEYDDEYDQEEFDDEENEYGDEQQEFVPPQIVFKDSSIRDPVQSVQKQFMEPVPEEMSPEVRQLEQIEEEKKEVS